MDAPRRCGKCKSPYWDRVNGKSVCSVPSRRSGIARQVQAGESGKGGLQEVPRGEVGGGFSEHIQIEAEVMREAVVVGKGNRGDGHSGARLGCLACGALYGHQKWCKGK